MAVTNSKKQVVFDTKIIDAPSFKSVLAAEHNSLTFRAAGFMAHVNDYEATVTECKVIDLRLDGIRSITFDSEKNSFSFEGDVVQHHEHTSYNQSSTRTERTSYRVIVFREGPWNRGWSDNLRAALIRL